MGTLQSLRIEEKNVHGNMRAGHRSTVRSSTRLGHTLRPSYQPITRVRRRAVPGPSDASSSDPFQFLAGFSKSEFKGTAASTYLASKASRDKLREAFHEAIETCNESIAWKGPANSPVLIGILSSDIRLALRSLRDFTEAFGVSYVVPSYIGQDGVIDASVALPSLRGPVYLRYRALPHAEPQCTVTRYQDKDRGVLVNFGTLQVGHLPLGLLDEDKRRDDAPCVSSRG